MMNANIFDLLKEFNLNDIVTLSERYARKVVRKLATSEKRQSDSYMDIMLDPYHNKEISEDLTATVYTELCEHPTYWTLAQSLHIDGHPYTLVTVSADITYQRKNAKKETTTAYYGYICYKFNMLMDSFKNPKVEPASDAISADTKDGEITTSKLEAIIDTLHANKVLNETYISNTLCDFYKYVRAMKKKDTADKMIRFCNYLTEGYKINTIAELMEVPTTTAYDLRKRVAKTYAEYKPLDRQRVDFAKVETVVHKWLPDTDGNDVLTPIESTTYKRIERKEATLTICGKKHKTIVTVTPAYTINHGYTISDSTTKANIEDVPGEIVEPKEHSRLKSYVINMTKDATADSSTGCAYRHSDTTAAGSYQFRYGDAITPWTYATTAVYPTPTAPTTTDISPEEYTMNKCNTIRHAERQTFYNSVWGIGGTHDTISKPSYAISDKWVFVFDNGVIRKYPVQQTKAK